MNFELMFQPLKKYADFQGRARRSEYWLFVLFVVVVYIVLGGLAGLGGASAINEAIFKPLLGLLVIGLLMPLLAVGVRRLHDIGQSGWLILLSFIPLLGELILLVLYVLPGTAGPNRYGPDPKEPSGGLAAIF